MQIHNFYKDFYKYWSLALGRIQKQDTDYNYEDVRILLFLPAELYHLLSIVPSCADGHVLGDVVDVSWVVNLRKDFIIA